jgi:hypothetical protein
MNWLDRLTEKTEHAAADVTGHARRDLERQLASLQLMHDGLLAHAEALVPLVEDTLKVVDPSISASVITIINDFVELMETVLQPATPVAVPPPATAPVTPAALANPAPAPAPDHIVPPG